MLKRTPLRAKAKTRLVSKKPLSKKSRNKKKNETIENVFYAERLMKRSIISNIGQQEGKII